MEEAMDKSDVFVNEMDMENLDVMGIMKDMINPKNSIKATLKEKDYVLLDSIVMAKFSVPVSVFDNIQPIIISSLIETTTGDEKDSSGLFLDLYLAQKSKANGKKVIGLETAAEQIKALNVATIITAPTLKAVAFFNPNNNSKMNQQEIENLIDKKNVSIMDTFKAWFKKTTKFVAMFVTDANGVQIEFPDVADGVEPEVGDVAKSADGTELNGEVVMATGETYVFEANVLTEKRPKKEEVETEVETETEPTELEAMKAKIESLEAELTKSKAEATSFKAQLKSVQTEKVKIKAQEEKTGEKQARKLTDYCK